MSTPSYVQVNVGEQKRLREFVLDNIGILDPNGERPVLKMLGRMDVDNVKVEWTEDEMETPSASNANIMGFQTSFAAGDWNVRPEYYNYCQLMDKPASEDLTSAACKYYGIPKGGELEYQKKKKYKALLNDVEAMLLSANTRVQPTRAAAGVSGGLRTFITTNKVTVGSGDWLDKKLSPELYRFIAKKISKAGGLANIVFCGTDAADDISGWVTQINRDVSDQGTTLTHVVTKYRTVAGTQDIVVHPQIETYLLMLTTEKAKTAWLREPQWHPYPDGLYDYKGGNYKTEVSCVIMNEKAMGLIDGLDYDN